MGERIEAIIRIPLGIFYLIILDLLGIVVAFLWIFTLFYTLILGKRPEGVSKFMNGFISLMYRVYRYVFFTTNTRPKLELQPIEPCDFEMRNE